MSPEPYLPQSPSQAHATALFAEATAPPLASRPSYETTATTSSTEGKEAVILADAWLPYRRPGRNSYQKLAAEFEELEKQASASSSSGRTSSSTITPMTEISRPSPPRISPSKPVTQQEEPTRVSPASEKSNTEPQMEDTIPIESPDDHGRMQPTTGSQYHSRFAPKQNVERVRSPMTTKPIANFSRPRSSQSVASPIVNPKPYRPVSVNKYQPSPEEVPTSFRVELPPTYMRPAPRQRSLSYQRAPAGPKKGEVDKTRSQSAWRPPSVWYENVEGVTLATAPKDAEEMKSGLSLPEIEARDIRGIPPRGRKKRHEEERPSEFEGQGDHYARSPPPIGSSDGGVRSISPRPVTEAQTHTFVDNYSRAVPNNVAEQRADLSDTVNGKWGDPARDSKDDAFFEWYTKAASDEMPNQRFEPRQPRHSMQAATRPVLPPETISERSEPQYNDSSDEGGAEPPDVARQRRMEEQEAEMKSRTDQVKSLLGGMMKSLAPGKSSKSKKDDDNNSRPEEIDVISMDAKKFKAHENSHQYPPHNDSTDTAFLWDDSDDARDSDRNTMIWSPPRASGRNSQETYRDKRTSWGGFSNGDESAQVLAPQMSTFASLGGPR